jgi:hypothetical protein
LSRRLILPFALLLCLFFMIVIVEGQPNEIVAVSGSTPMIDGVIGGEWGDASSLSFNNTEVFVKQDGENLYIAFNVSDATFNADENVHVFFDVNHDVGTSPKSDDILIGVFRNGTLIERYLVNGTDVNATGWTASVSNTTQLWQAEFNITYSKINVTAGVTKTLGVAFEVIDYSFPYLWQSWPHDLRDGDPLDPSRWGDMISTGYNWIPELTSFLVLPLFTITLLLAVFISRRKHTVEH